MVNPCLGGRDKDHEDQDDTFLSDGARVVAYGE